LKFVRVALIEFSRLDRIVADLTVQYSGAEVRMHRAAGQKLPEGSDPALADVYLAMAYADLNQDALTRSAFLHIDDEMRRACETAIEGVANAVAISNRCARRIESCSPFFFLAPENEVDIAQLPEIKFAVAAKLIPRVDVSTGIPLIDAPNLLGDRQVGAALLSEAFGNTNALGRYRDFVRVFELAFRLDPKSLAAPLAEFLDPAALGYSEAEVSKWLRVRNAASHGDLKWPDSWIAFERDVQLFIARMEQGALDVLFNKKLWSDPSTRRRDVWYPTTATIDPIGGLRVTEGEFTRVAVLDFAMDCFDAWPVRMSAGNLSPPLGWWAPSVLPADSVPAPIIVSPPR
jgi:hypothetical protein